MFERKILSACVNHTERVPGQRTHAHSQINLESQGGFRNPFVEGVILHHIGWMVDVLDLGLLFLRFFVRVDHVGIAGCWL
jgi:hypothetical protein